MRPHILIPLYYKPLWEACSDCYDYAPDWIDASTLRNMASRISQRLNEAADLVEKLTKSGWEIEIAAYHIICYNDAVKSNRDLYAAADALGVNPNYLRRIPPRPRRVKKNAVQ